MCEPLRLFGTPLKLGFDITITTDIFTVIVDPIQPQSKVNGIMLQYLSILKRFPKQDNTIDLEFKLQGVRHSTNCVIDIGMEAPISISLLNLLQFGMQFSLGNSIINSNSLLSTNPPVCQPSQFMNHESHVSNIPKLQCCKPHRSFATCQRETNRSKNKKIGLKNARNKDKIVVTFNNDHHGRQRRNTSTYKGKNPRRISSVVSKIGKEINEDCLDVNVNEADLESIRKS